MTARARTMARRQRVMVVRDGHRARPYVLVIGHAPRRTLEQRGGRRRATRDDRLHRIAAALVLLMGAVGFWLVLTRTAS